jgi:copper(I)-binding protein
MKAKRIAAAPVLALSLAAWLAGLAAPPADAQGARIGDLVITRAWIRATPEGVPTAAAYLTIANRGPAPDRLLGGSAPGVKAITPHTMSMSGGVMRMRALSQGLDIPGGRAVTLGPGGDHLMLEGLTRAFRPGQSLPVRLRFARAGDVKVAFQVSQSEPSSEAGMGKMKMR